MEPLSHERRAALEGRFAEISLARTLNMKLDRVAVGECDLRLEDRRDLDGIFQSLHGGILATLADSAVAFAALTVIDPAETITTVEFNIRFLAPCRESVVARARLIKAGRTLITADVQLVGTESGKIFAVCGVTYIRLRA